EILIPDADIKDFGIFITSLYSIDENTSLQGGIRYDFRNMDTKKHIILHDHEGIIEEHIFEPLNKDFNSFNASFGFKTTLFKNIITRVNIASGFRAPNIAELTSNGVHHGTNRFEKGNTNLNSEQNIQTDINLEYQDEHFEIYANGFYNNIKDFIYISPTGEIEDNHEVYEYTQNNSNLYGGEFGFHLHPHPIHWLHLESYLQTVIGKQDNGEYLPLIPANKLSNTIRSEFDINEVFNEVYISINLNSYFKQDNTDLFENSSPGYSLFNFSLGSNIHLKNTQMTTYFSINNLLNKAYISHLSTLKTDGIPNAGRNISLGVNIEI
ncbi:MAG: TonB-dependent receptor, partial [Flavobacteriaceae bacterium]|nr:TonB-dependent receptor [Flavobacteriaceae bacterium]